MPVGQHLHGNPRADWLRPILLGGLAVQMLLAPGIAGAQATGPDSSADKNITTQVQKEAPVALPSLSPLVQHVLPAVVNISAQLGSEAAAQSKQPAEESDPTGTPFDELFRRYFENRTPQAGREITA